MEIPLDQGYVSMAYRLNPGFSSYREIRTYKMAFRAIYLPADSFLIS